MKKPPQTLISYLLGELSEAEQTALEQEYFADPQLFDQLVATENDLLDQYARGQLSPATRRRWEEHYLAHPNRRERAKFSEALAIQIDRAAELPPSAIRTVSWWKRLLPAQPGPRLAWAFSLVLLILIAGVGWLAIQTRRLHQERTQEEAERVARGQRERDLQQQLAGERTHADQLAAELDRLRLEGSARQTPTPVNPAAPALATLLLNITGVRGAETGPPARLVIAPGTEQARIQLNLRENDYQSYSIAIESAEGRRIFYRDRLQATKRHKTLSVIVPTHKLPNGDYFVTLKGVTTSGEVEEVSKSIFHVSQSPVH
jgi:hypothetical protein